MSFFEERKFKTKGIGTAIYTPKRNFFMFQELSRNGKILNALKVLT